MAEYMRNGIRSNFVFLIAKLLNSSLVHDVNNAEIIKKKGI